MCCKPPCQLATSHHCLPCAWLHSRACEKIVLQPSPSLGSLPGAVQICDIVRMMSVCKTLSDMAELLDQIRKSSHIEVVRFKDRIKNPSGGWRDAMINFCVKDSACPHHICEVQIVHQKMALCRRKDGLGGHDVYAQERNAREILEFQGKTVPEKEDPANRARRASPSVRAAFRADAEKDKKVAEAAMTWIRQTKLRIGAAFRARKWYQRAMATSRVLPTGSLARLWPERSESKVEPAAIAAETAPAPVASESSRPESSASKYAVVPGKETGGTISLTDLT